MADDKILRFPRLDTVLMVENAIQEYDGEFKKKALWSNLPKKMMYQTFCVIIDYLLYSRKISIDSEGKIGWIYYPEKTSEHIKNKELFWKKDEVTI
jgi:phage pi2 protein 07